MDVNFCGVHLRKQTYKSDDGMPRKCIVILELDATAAQSIIILYLTGYNLQVVSSYINEWRYLPPLHHITLHDNRLRHISMHCTLLHHLRLQHCCALRSIVRIYTVYWITLPYPTLPHTTLHYTALLCISLYWTRSHYIHHINSIALHYIALH